MKRALVIALLLASARAWAHKPSDAHLAITVSGDQLGGTLAVALRDLDGALDLDTDGDGAITWREALAAAPRIDAYARARLSVRGDGEPCTVAFGAGQLADYSDGAYWSMPLAGACRGAPDTLTVGYALLFDIDAQHRGIVQIVTARGAHTAVVRDARAIALVVGDGGAAGALAAGFAWAATAPALLLCLACLVLPALLDRRARQWRTSPARDALRTAWTSAGAFALASSAAALAATAGLLALPSHVVALAVVLTVAVAALATFVRRSASRWDLAFELGLLHGLASAAALAARAPAAKLGALAFVVGVVAAELLAAAAAVALAFAVRRAFTHRPLVWAWSGAAAAAALVWAGWIA